MIPFGNLAKFRILPWTIIAVLAICRLVGDQASAQDDPNRTPTILAADRVRIIDDQRLVAEGNVEVLRNGSRIQAQRVAYDRISGQLSIGGPIRIKQADGTVLILAETAELNSDLRDGLIRSARILLSQRIQVATAQINRIEGRYNRMSKATLTSCRVCNDGRPPLWQFRARKVLHDTEERQIYLEDVQFLIRDIPVFFLPKLRVPDPTLDRARGFLVPTFHTSSKLGPSVTIPYFLPIGDHRDLTVAPMLSPRTATLNLRYRQAFARGRIQVEGAASRDSIWPNERTYLFGDGNFDLRNDWKANFAVRTASDAAYLSTYNISTTDRLRSQAEFHRVRRDESIRLTSTYYRSLRDDTPISQLPDTFVSGHFRRRVFPASVGGEVGISLAGNAYLTASDADIQGRDVARGTGDLVWRGHRFGTGGLRHDWLTGLSADLFHIQNDSNYDNFILRTTPRASYRLALPMGRSGNGGSRQILEPFAQLGWAQVNGKDVPRDESRFAEFDQGNILSLSRFPSPETRESATTLAYGLNWARHADEGNGAWVTVAQVLRSKPDPHFLHSSGLAGNASDLLIAGQLRWPNKTAISARTLLNSGLGITKAELRGSRAYTSGKVAAALTYLEPDPGEARSDRISELHIFGSRELNNHWRTEASIRYSFSDSRPREAGIRMVYAIECVEMELFLKRRHLRNAAVDTPSVLGFNIELKGFSSAGIGKQVTSCKH